jgi:hypothetical protein
MRRVGSGRSWPGSSFPEHFLVEDMSVLPLLRQNGGMQHRLRLAATAAAALVLLVPAQAAVAGTPGTTTAPASVSAADAPDRPRLLQRAGHGRAVVEALGDRLPQAAATNQMSTTKLRGLLEEDSSAWLGADGQLFYVEEAATSAACGGLCSGVALVGTFDDYSRTDSYYEPAWVFTSKTYDSAVLTAHTVAHEVGHTLGLNHDGNSVTSYSSGHANWFPLMGSSTKGVGQWSKGEYFDANNTEDDLAVMTANGAPVRVDDHGSDRATARQLGAAESYVVDGVISTRADQDVFAIDRQCTEPLAAAVGGVGPGASLDLRLEVLGSDGTVLAADDPTSWHDTSQWPAVPTGMHASLTAPTGVGTYYLRVDGVGKGNPSTDGYSDYGSLGVYRLVVAGCGGTLPPLTTPSTITNTTTGTTTGGTTTAQAPSAPLIGRAAPGRRGGKVTALARWAAPVSTGGATIVGYRVKAEKLSSSGRVLRVVTSSLISSSARTKQMRLPQGRYRFRVIAYNRVGASPVSTVSRTVTAR